MGCGPSTAQPPSSTLAATAVLIRVNRNMVIPFRARLFSHCEHPSPAARPTLSAPIPFTAVNSCRQGPTPLTPRQVMLAFMKTPAPAATPLPTPQTVAAFQADGAVLLRGLLQADEVARLRAGIEANLARLSPRAKVASGADDPGSFIEDFCCWQENEHYRQVIFGSRLGEVGAQLMRSGTARLYHDHMLTKEGGTRQPTPWHQDQPYYNIAGSQNCSFWIPVDAVGREATLEFVAGSHRGPWLMPRSFRDAQAKWFPAGSLAELPDIDAHREAHRILGWELQPG